MSPENRRDFLRQTTAGLAGMAVIGPGRLGAAVADGPTVEADPDLEVIPPHRPWSLSGIHAYAEPSVAAGEVLHLRVSSTLPYTLEIRRLGAGVDDPSTDEVIDRFAPSGPSPREIHPGSYLHVERGLPADRAWSSLAVQTWVRPWRLDRGQALISEGEWPGRAGFALRLDATGRIQFELGDGGPDRPGSIVSGPKLQARRWQHVVGAWDGRSQAIWLDGLPAAVIPREGSIRTVPGPIRIGAAGRDGRADDFLDGDLAGPALWGRALEADEIGRLHRGLGLEPPDPDGLLAHWPLDEEAGATVTDRSDWGRHGRIINRGTWMIGGPSFDAEAVPRFGPYDPARDDRRGHGLRLAADDLYDCRWPVTHECPIPPTARSGIHVARFVYESDGEPRRYDVTFLVRRPADRPPAPIVVLCATNTWRAYSATPFAANVSGPTHWPTGGLRNDLAEAPSYCCYRDHHAGQPTYQVGLRLPWPAAGPEVLYSPPGVGYSHLMRSERFAHAWLDEQGYAYDVIGDSDLHQDPEILEDYRAVVVNGHSEYWSIPAYEGLDRYLRGGGRAVVLSGNTMFWRVSFDAEGAVMECRKFDPSIGGRPAAAIGELWHGHDRKRGSLMREAGYPAWAVIGLDTLGYWGTGKGAFGVYTAEATDHPLFREPERTDLAKGDTFGHSPDGGEPRAGGHEADVRLATLRSMTLPPLPPDAELPEEPEGFTTLARCVRQPTSGTTLDYFGRPARSPEGVCAEVILWERPQGGTVFHGGTIAGGWALSADERWGTLLRNVLNRYGVVPNRT